MSGSTKSLIAAIVISVGLIVLKLVGVIDWSWWIVTLPVYGTLILFLVVVIVAYGLMRK